jgi:lysophospholipase L1-like esterase
VVARWNGATVRINALGYRSPEISRIKPARTFRVVVLGSSNTFGHGVEDGEAYPRLLETWLASRVPPGRRVEVVNLAVSGDAPTQRLHRLRTEVEALDPDWIFCDASALDLSLEEIHLRQVLQKKWAIPYQFVAQALREAGVSGVEPSEEFHARLSRFLRPALERTYAAWAAEARRLNTPLTVVLLPRADSKEPSSRLFEICREFADRQGLGLIDLSDTFDDFALDDYRVAPWDLHPNPLGHKLIARKLKLALLEIDEFESRLMGDAVNGYLTAK